MTIQLPNPVLGIGLISSRLRKLAAVAPSDVEWLLSARRTSGGSITSGSGSVSSSSGGSSSGGGGGSVSSSDNSSGSEDALCLGFDTEFSVDKLALIQLCNADRVLLIRVPASAPLKAPVPTCLVELLTSPLILKAAAEAWQDVLMVYHSLGMGIAGGVCLTTALASLFPNAKPGLFAMMHKVFPGSGLEKDRVTTTSDWLVKALNQEQLRYAALDAFVSWAVAAGRRDLVDQVRRLTLITTASMCLIHLSV